jgi:hypothetical protein
MADSEDASRELSDRKAETLRKAREFKAYAQEKLDKAKNRT